MEEVARVVLALESPEVAEEVMHFLDRSGRARVVGTAADERQLVEAVRSSSPTPSSPHRRSSPSSADSNGSALLAVDTAQSVATLRRAIRAGASGFYPVAGRTRGARARGRAAAAVVRARTEGRARGRRRLRLSRRMRERRSWRPISLRRSRTSGAPVLLLDLDAAFADASAAIGVPADEAVRTICGSRAARRERSVAGHVEEIVWRHPDGFGVLLAPGSTGRRRSARGPLPARDRRGASTCDVVMLHRAARCSTTSRGPALELADRVVVVARARRAVVPRREAGDRGRRRSRVDASSSSTGLAVGDRPARRRAGVRRVRPSRSSRRLEAIVAAQEHGRLLPAPRPRGPGGATAGSRAGRSRERE